MLAVASFAFFRCPDPTGNFPALIQAEFSGVGHRRPGLPRRARMEKLKQIVTPAPITQMNRYKNNSECRPVFLCPHCRRPLPVVTRLRGVNGERSAASGRSASYSAVARGKTMLAKRVPMTLPDLTSSESIEIRRIYAPWCGEARPAAVGGAAFQASGLTPAPSDFDPATLHDWPNHVESLTEVRTAMGASSSMIFSGLSRPIRRVKRAGALCRVKNNDSRPLILPGPIIAHE